MLVQLNWNARSRALLDLQIVEGAELISFDDMPPHWLLDLSEGRLSKHRYLQLVSRAAKITTAQVISAERKIIGEPNWELLNYLKKFDDVIIFSNTNSIHWEAVLEKIPILYGFRHVLSFECGFRKPDIEAFQAVTAMIDFDHDQLLYVDDEANNLNAAARLGWAKTILHTDNAHTISQLLRELG